MRRTLQVSVLCFAAGVVSACSNPEQVIQNPVPPTAGVRFINAVPDTGAMDLRFQDIVEDNAHYDVPFRNTPSTVGGVTISTQIEYKNTQAGQRHFKIFMYGTTAKVASTVVKDTTVTIEAGKLYTALLWGNARGSGPKLLFYEEKAPDPQGNVALRVLNTTGSAIDVREYVSTGTMPAGATWSNVAPYSLSSYVTAAPGQFKFNVQPAGGGSALFSDALALPGTKATVDADALPGTTVAGSAVTAIIWPKSVSGSDAASFSAPGVSFVWDRRPPRPNGV